MVEWPEHCSPNQSLPWHFSETIFVPGPSFIGQNTISWFLSKQVWILIKVIFLFIITLVSD